MAIRDIIQIDEALCDGCGQCVPSCVEGALRVIDGKARLVSDVLCDGLGACLGHCPTDALQVIARAADAFDEAAVAAHTTARRAQAPPPARSIPVSAQPAAHSHAGGGCPGSRVQMFDDRPAAHGETIARHPANLGFIGARPQVYTTPPSPGADTGIPASRETPRTSRLRQWPVQLHLLPPTAPFLRGQPLLLAADCVPVALPDFHESLLAGRSLAIACPKLDQDLEMYVEKLTAMIDAGDIASLQVAIMEVPCCGGLARLAQQAVARAQRKIPLEVTTIGIRGGRM